MKKGIFGFGKKEYQTPQVSPVPADQETRQSGTFINEEKRHIRVELFDYGTPQDLERALGILVVAADVVKKTLSEWHMKDARRSSIIIPKVNGNA